MCVSVLMGLCLGLYLVVYSQKGLLCIMIYAIPHLTSVGLGLEKAAETRSDFGYEWLFCFSCSNLYVECFN